MNNPIAVSLAAGLTGLALWSGAATAPSPTAGPDAAAPILVQESGEFRWSGAMEAGTTLEIKGVNGDVTAEGISGGQAEVVAVKKGKDDDPSEVRIEVVEHAGGVTICALHPRKPGKEPYECAPGKSGKIGAEDNDVSVKFTVRRRHRGHVDRRRRPRQHRQRRRQGVSHRHGGGSDRQRLRLGLDGPR
jgi:hypothetical protein